MDDSEKRAVPDWIRRDEQERYKALDVVHELDSDLETFLVNFQDHIIDDQCSDSRRENTHGIAFLQSSGCGKSRLIRQIGSRVPSFVITLGDLDAPNPPLPRPDKAVCDILRRNGLDGHSRVAAFLSALFKELYLYIAASFYEETRMDPDELSNTVSLMYGSIPRDEEEEEETEFAYTHLQALAGEYIKETGKNKTIDDVCRILQQLQSGPAGSKCQERRKFFLERVKIRTESLMTKVYYTALDYLYFIQVELGENIDNFFNLLDGTLDGDGRKHSLSKYAQTSPKRHQFIFGVDECHEAVNLIKMRNDETPHGISAFTKVFNDLSWWSNDGEHPIGRVWLALLSSQGLEAMLTDHTYDSVYRATPSLKNLMTIWMHYGEDLALLSKLTQEQGYINNLTIGQLHHLKHLQLTGRGLWAAHKRLDTLLDLAIIKLTGRSHKGEAIGLSSETGEILRLLQHNYDQIRPYGRYDLDLVIYAVASLRFGLDCESLLVDRQLPAVLAIASGMRILKGFDRNHRVTTCTPSEPLLALAALVLLNYGQSYIGGMYLDPLYFDLYREDDSTNREQVHKDFKDIPWRNMLKEVASALKVNPELFDVGDQAQLISRIILTRARDCTLPESFLIKDASAPLTTLGDVITKLVGIAAAEVLKCHWAKEWKCREDKEKIPKRRNWCARIWTALVNFNQFVPYATDELREAPSSAEEGPEDQVDSDDEVDEKNSEDLEEAEDFYKYAFARSRLMEGFQRQSAYVCMPDTPGAHLAIPIMVPREETYELLSKGKLTLNETSLSDYDVEYVALLSRWDEGVAEDDFALFSTPVYDQSGDIKSNHAVMSIFMDMGAREPFSHSAGWHRRAKILTSSVAGGVERQNEVFKDEHSYFLSLRIRGMNSAYPCLREIDEIVDDEYRFEKGVRDALTKRREPPPGSRVHALLPNFGERLEDFPGLEIYRTRKEEFEGKRVEYRDLLRASLSPPSSP